MNALIVDFIKDCRDSGLVNLHVVDRLIAKKFRVTHMRSGRISSRVSREGAAAHVVAYAYDDLGHIWALCGDGYCRTFFRNSYGNRNI